MTTDTIYFIGSILYMIFLPLFITALYIIYHRDNRD